MNTKQELVDAMNGESDHSAPPAVFSQTATTSQMDSCGYGWPESNFDCESMAKLALQPHESFGFSMARVPFDLTAEANRLGCTINKGDKNRQPAVTDSPWRNEIIDAFPEDIMPPDEFLDEGRCRCIIDAAEHLHTKHEDLFIVASMVDPLELAFHMVGAENLLMNIFMDEAAAESWVRSLTPYQCKYAEALSSVSDNIFVIVEAAEDIISPDMFETFIGKYDRKIFSSIKESFSTAHTCGLTTDILEDLASLGETALSVESDGNPESIMDRIGGKAVPIGGIDPISDLLQGTHNDIKKKAKRYSEAGYSIIAPECGVPPMTADENLIALSHYRD